MKSNLQDVALSLKVLISFFLIFVGIGYLLGLINIYNNTGFSYTGVVVHYRGMGAEQLPVEFAVSKLVQTHHAHLFALSMLFFLVGAVFTCTRLPEKAKIFFVAAPFAGMFLDFTSFWLLVLTSQLFAWIAIFFGGFMAFSFFLLIGRPLYEMWILPLWVQKWGENIPWYFR